MALFGTQEIRSFSGQLTMSATDPIGLSQSLDFLKESRTLVKYSVLIMEISARFKKVTTDDVFMEIKPLNYDYFGFVASTKDIDLASLKRLSG